LFLKKQVQDPPDPVRNGSAADAWYVVYNLKAQGGLSQGVLSAGKRGTHHELTPQRESESVLR